MMRKEINRYRCVGDSGREYTVIERQNFTRIQPLNSPAQDLPGTLDWILSDGGAVNFIDDNTFQILNTDDSFGRSTRANLVQYMPPPLACIPTIA
jgi:hypothetical protein